MEVLVLGHRNPDTDAICASIGYAYLKNAEREAGAPQALPGPAVAGRLGELRPETAFVLERWGVPVPPLVGDVRGRAKDIMRREPVAVRPCVPLLEAGRCFDGEVKLVPVVDEEQRLLGVVTAGDIARQYLEGERNPSHRYSFPADNLLQTLKGEWVVPPQGEEEPVSFCGRVLVAAMSRETMLRYIQPGDLVLVGDRPEAQVAALEAGASCLIVTGGLAAAPAAVEEARKRKAGVMVVPWDTYRAAQLIKLSLPVEHAMTRQVVTFHPDDLLTEVRERMKTHHHRHYPVVDERERLLGLVTRGSLLRAEGRPVILVDHNERSQAVEGIEEAKILEIIDHHRLGDLQTLSPVYFRNEPVGSTSTIVARLFWERKITLPSSLAGLLLAGLLSDTMGLRSPTTTPLDEEVAERLAQAAGVERREFYQALLQAATSLEGVEPAALLRRDFKEFRFGGGRYGIGQVETADASAVEAVKEELLREMERLCREEGYELVALMVTDLLREGTTLYAVGPGAYLVEEAFGEPLRGQAVFLPGVVSRKQQVVPPLARAVEGRGR
ncbi:MAG: putative manganese-dependent inorganic diphosphatase [Bacillota bacterium]|nr:putative manganese-dependent inorganic diphosphatase [Bacillota bacterium]